MINEYIFYLFFKKYLIRFKGDFIENIFGNFKIRLNFLNE